MFAIQVTKTYGYHTKFINTHSCRTLHYIEMIIIILTEKVNQILSVTPTKLLSREMQASCIFIQVFVEIDTQGTQFLLDLFDLLLQGRENCYMLEKNVCATVTQQTERNISISDLLCPFGKMEAISLAKLYKPFHVTLGLRQQTVSWQLLLNQKSKI